MATAFGGVAGTRSALGDLGGGVLFEAGDALGADGVESSSMRWASQARSSAVIR
ncbi:MAG: hypothetical protein P8Y58_18230 [Novosphingobium sp.]